MPTSKDSFASTIQFKEHIPLLSLKSISLSLYSFLVISLLVDVAGGLGIKQIALLLVIVWLVVSVQAIRIPRTYLLFDWLVVSFFLFSATYGIWVGLSLRQIATGLSFTVYYALLPLLLLIPSRQIISRFVTLMTLAGVAIIAIFLVLQLYPGFVDYVSRVSNEYGFGYIGLRPIPGLAYELPNVYFRWSIWLIPAALLIAGRGKYRTALVVVAVLLTFSTAIVASVAVGLCLLLFLLRKKQKSWKLVIVWSTTILLLAYIVLFTRGGAHILDFLLSKFSDNSLSTHPKIMDIKDILSIVVSSPVNLILGTGPGSTFYATSVGKYVFNVEVSQFNFLREFGILGVAVWFSYIGYVAVRAFRTGFVGRRLSVGLCLSFIAAGTNPVLMSPIFFTILMISRAYEVRSWQEARYAK